MKGRISMVTEGARQIYEAVSGLNKTSVDLRPWKRKIDGEDLTEAAAPDEGSDQLQQLLTIGMIGQPNAGKSSLINSLMGKRVVSVSKTPGHTKHFQTIHITRGVVLMDCPGLVFPSIVERPLQVVLGSYPIAQVREPFSVVQFLAEKVDLITLLKLRNQGGQLVNLDTVDKFSAYDICELWAQNRGYVTARSNRPDVSRSANHILRMSLEGKITLAYLPPGYVSQKTRDEYESHPDLVRISQLLALDQHQEEDEHENNLDFDSPDEDEVDEESSSEEGQAPPPPVVTNKFALLDDET